MNWTRRKFLAAGGATAALTTLAGAGVWRVARPRGRRFTGGIVGGNSPLGHALRDGKFPPPDGIRDVGVVIVGGGIGGLAAARRLRRAGREDFVLLELEARAGGNAISGQNGVSAYPWAAHYVPIAGSDAAEISRLFEELGVITGRDSAGLPVYAEEYLCADPMERLFIHGRWQEGFLPQTGLRASDERVIQAFLAEMQRLKGVRGRDGRRAFALPVDQSSGDDEFRKLDRMTMAEYLAGHGWLACEPLRWYVNYCCRDDYGAGLHQVSAWAGIHYFASRDGRAANAPDHAVVTWPAGNGWLAQRLEAGVAGKVRSECAVWNVATTAAGFLVDYYDARAGKSFRLRARGVVWAAPAFIAQRAIPELREAGNRPAVVYSPWLVANLTLDAVPGGRGMAAAWDNVIYGSETSLGYVVATHQDVRPVPGRTVITYYLPLDADEPAVARTKALARSYDSWCEQILVELAVAHPEIPGQVGNLDIWLWGHAMVRPVPGYLWGGGRERAQLPLGNLVFAHSDQSGVALFEEAYTRGVKAAEELLARLGDPPGKA